MSEWGSSGGGIVDIQAVVLLGVEFFTSVELFVFGLGSVVCRSQLTWNVRRPTIFYCLLVGSVVIIVGQLIYILVGLLAGAGVMAGVAV